MNVHEEENATAGQNSREQSNNYVKPKTVIIIYPETKTKIISSNFSGHSTNGAAA